jgi:hypothetical protein
MQENKIACDYCGSFMDGGYKINRVLSDTERVQLVMMDLTPLDFCCTACIVNYFNEDSVKESLTVGKKKLKG